MCKYAHINMYWKIKINLYYYNLILNVKIILNKPVKYVINAVNSRAVCYFRLLAALSAVYKFHNINSNSF